MKKTVLITGASRGIGADIARRFAAEGYRLALNFNHSSEEAKRLEQELDAEVVLCRADISKRDEVEAMAEQILSQLGGIDVIVNNAGIAQQKLFSDITEAEWDRMFAVNIKGMYLVTKAFLPAMIHEKRGSIVNLSSIWGITGASCEVHYSASKAAVIGFTKALAKELGPSHIRVNCVAPGVIRTQMNANLSVDALEQLTEETPLGRMGTAMDVAEAVYYLSSDCAGFVTGQVLSPNGGIVI